MAVLVVSASIGPCEVSEEGSGGSGVENGRPKTRNQDRSGKMAGVDEARLANGQSWRGWGSPPALPASAARARAKPPNRYPPSLPVQSSVKKARPRPPAAARFAGPVKPRPPYAGLRVTMLGTTLPTRAAQTRSLNSLYRAKSSGFSRAMITVIFRDVTPAGVIAALLLVGRLGLNEIWQTPLCAGCPGPRAFYFSAASARGHIPARAPGALSACLLQGRFACPGFRPWGNRSHGTR